MKAALMMAAALLLLPPLAGPAQAVSVRDLIELSRAGLGDEVLLALIEVDGTIFAMDAPLIRSLKESGISDRVIEAMIRNGRSRIAEPEGPPVEAYEPPSPPPVPAVIIERIVERREEPRQVVVPVPVYVAVPVSRSSSRRPLVRAAPAPRTGFEVYVPQAHAPEPKKPVYWGWGGKLRPDAWKPAGYREEPSEKSEKKDGGKKRH